MKKKLKKNILWLIVLALVGVILNVSILLIGGYILLLILAYSPFGVFVGIAITLLGFSGIAICQVYALKKSTEKLIKLKQNKNEEKNGNRK